MSSRRASMLSLLVALASGPASAAAWTPATMTEQEKSAMWALHGVVACAVANAPTVAEALLRTDEGSSDERLLLTRLFAPNAVCAVARDLGPTSRLRGIVAERLYRRRFVDLPKPPFADSANDTSAGPLVRAANCFAAASPLGADRFLRTQVDTDAEDAALSALTSAGSTCVVALPTGTTLFALRAAVGSAQYARMAPAAIDPSVVAPIDVIRHLDEQASHVAALSPRARRVPPAKDPAAPVAECLVRESNGLAAQVLATLPGSEASAQALTVANLDHCRMFTAPPLARAELRGAIASRIWQQEYGPRSSSRPAHRALFVKPTAAGLRALSAASRQQTAMVLVGQCTAAAQPAAVSAIVDTIPGTDIEKRAIANVGEAWAQCAADAGLTSVMPLLPRAALLEGLYRDAVFRHATVAQ